jgi:hypothetical protein
MILISFGYLNRFLFGERPFKNVFLKCMDLTHLVKLSQSKSAKSITFKKGFSHEGCFPKW